MYLSYLDTEDRKLFLELAYKIANPDKVIAEQEQELLESFRDEMNLSHLEYEIQNISLDSILGQLKERAGHIKRMIFLEALATAFADGVYEDAESDII